MPPAAPVQPAVALDNAAPPAPTQGTDPDLFTRSREHVESGLASTVIAPAMAHVPAASTTPAYADSSEGLSLEPGSRTTIAASRSAEAEAWDFAPADEGSGGEVADLAEAEGAATGADHSAVVGSGGLAVSETTRATRVGSGLRGNPPPQPGPRRGRDEFPDLVTLERHTLFQPIAAERFLFGDWLQAGNVSAIVGPPGVGKSLYVIAMAVSVATGAVLAGERAQQPQPSLIVNAEDSTEVTWRRARAVAAHMGADMGLLAQNLQVMETRQSFRLGQKNARREIGETERALTFWTRLMDKGIRFAALDPYIEFTAGNEADNDDQHAIMSIVRRQARRLMCSVVIVHHTGKVDGRPSLASIRGASAIGGVVRSARVVTELTKKDVDRLGLSGGAERDYFMVDDLKNSYAPRRQQPMFFRRVSTLIDGAATPYIEHVDPDSVPETDDQR